MDKIRQVLDDGSKVGKKGIVAIQRQIGEKPLLSLGIVGAVAGGWLFGLLGMHGVTGLNIYSLVVAIAGAVVLLVLYHAVLGVTY